MILATLHGRLRGAVRSTFLTPHHCLTLSWTLAGLFPAAVLAADAAGSLAEFNPAFLQGGSRIDVSRFSRGNPVLPGEYVVDLYVNETWLSRVAVRFVGQPDSDIALPCINRALLERVELDLGKLSESARSAIPRAGSTACMDLKKMIKDAAVSFDISRLRLDISIPQAAMLQKPRDYVAPELWDNGVPSGTLGYNLNAYRATTAGRASTRAHADLTAGINIGSWHLRQRSSVDVTEDGTASYQGIVTYLAHDIPSIRSDLVIGDSFTDGAVFDSFGFRGVSLASNDQMLPDSRLEFAPVVRGIAQTNARVVIIQNGTTILETTVSPGAFEINDLYATGYGGDLEVVVHEADGSQQRFTVPYTSMVQLLRPGVWRYTATAGELQQALDGEAGRFAQATLQHGFNSYLTGYAGAVGAENYNAGLLGIAVNTRAGALSADLTRSSASITDTSAFTGQALRLSYSKLFRDSRTNLTLATYRFSSQGYFSFAGALSARRSAQSGSSSDADHARNQLQITVNQTLPARWGNLYLTASAIDYWRSPKLSSQLQGGYTNHFRIGETRLSYGIALAHQKNALTGKPSNRIQASVSLPLGKSVRAPTLSTNFTQSTTDGDSTRRGQAVISGTRGDSSQLSYNVSASQAPEDAAYAASGQYRGAYASTSASVSAGKAYSQQAMGATGGLVIHRGGITFSNQMTDTFGIVEAIGAEGARVTNSIGTVINGAGYAVLPFLLPYRMNNISIDPEGISQDVEFKTTTRFVAPRSNAVVLIRFETLGGRAILITASLPDGAQVPFGASVHDAQGSEVGLTGQDGRIYLRGIAESGTLTARWGDAPDQQCTIKYQLPGKQKDDGPFVRIDARCEPVISIRTGQ